MTTHNLPKCANKDCTEPLVGWVNLIPIDLNHPDLTDSLPVPLCEDCAIRFDNARQKTIDRLRKELENEAAKGSHAGA